MVWGVTSTSNNYYFFLIQLVQWLVIHYQFSFVLSIPNDFYFNNTVIFMLLC